MHIAWKNTRGFWRGDSSWRFYWVICFVFHSFSFLLRSVVLRDEDVYPIFLFGNFSCSSIFRPVASVAAGPRTRKYSPFTLYTEGLERLRRRQSTRRPKQNWEKIKRAGLSHSSYESLVFCSISIRHTTIQGGGGGVNPFERGGDACPSSRLGMYISDFGLP